MSQKPQDYVANTYAPRAADYVNSQVHANGPDLLYIRNLLQNEKQAFTLDLGCGGGHVSYTIAPLVKQVVACDITQSMLDSVQQTAKDRDLSNIETQCAPAECLPFDQHTFDWVISRFSAHHWHDLASGLKEIKRILKPKGKAILIDTLAPLDKTADTHLQTIELLRDPSHVRNYNLAEWVNLFSTFSLNLLSVTQHRLRLEFQSWTNRTKTPDLFKNTILILQKNAPLDVKSTLNFEQDGSFTLPTAVFVIEA
ncbi:class I SAM-dependent methyltransferase [Commensalibacter oyaizuii]|uniref:Class I SAM-dependent methyltransferase n=1 Tax=Commensalibacter oyaizuii TaxID=3043873 RepID=A0ABT6PYX7_9PROT|nr:class I SAM-dependent methyltransferase [Commensalibacter sp. TBRC 16381]MDI2089928.1 class I SAM-dependent methyltransferase [Commensalibacter sp. TBRC 16381]